MVSSRKVKASFTVEAAFVCPFLCLILCGMIQFTLRLYATVDAYTEELLFRQEELLSRQKWEGYSSELIRLEAVSEDLF